MSVLGRGQQHSYLPICYYCAIIQLIMKGMQRFSHKHSVMNVLQSDGWIFIIAFKFLHFWGLKADILRQCPQLTNFIYMRDEN